MSSFKRSRTLSQSSSGSSSRQPEPAPKSTRTDKSGEVAHPVLCTLPPTCNPPHNPPTLIANTKDLELHYGNFHAHVCEDVRCRCVFPEARLLELHQTECHDPLAAMRKDRDEKIFACHLASCSRLFLTPKARRLHLVQAHAYPKEYFFAVTNKGVGGLLKKWGEGASMVRGEWKPRPNGTEVLRESDDDVDILSGDVTEEDYPNTPTPPSYTEKNIHEQQMTMDTSRADNTDDITQSMSSLSLVPRTIRFGRGGKNGGFVNRGGHPAHPSVVEHEDGASRKGRGRGSLNLTPNVNGSNVAKTRGIDKGDVLANGVGRGATKVDHLAAGNSPAARGFVPRGIGRAGMINVMRGRVGGIRGRGRGRGVAMGGVV